MIVRVCAEKNKKLENVAILKGVIAIVFNEQKTFAYGYGLKSQGGNDFGDYHIIGCKDNDSFKFSVGHFQPFDGFYDEYRATAEKITTDFNEDDARKYFESYEDNSLSFLKDKFVTDLYNPALPDICSDKEHKIFAIYFSITIFSIILYSAVDLRLLDAFNLAFTTISSGGFINGTLHCLSRALLIPCSDKPVSSNI